LTAIVVALAVILVAAGVRFLVAARKVRTDRASEGGQATLMVDAMEGAIENLRRQERAMKARAEASERLSEEIIGSLTSGLLVVDERGVVRTMNPAGRRLLAVADEGLDRAHHDVFRSLPALVELIDECLREARPVVRRTIEATTARSERTHLGVTVSPIRGEGGRAYGAICLFSDLTQIVELEEQLRLKDSLARLGELTAGIAHEFRNGLATIHGYSRLLDLEQLPESFRPYVVAIRQETEALGQVVTNFLNFARPTQLTLMRVEMRRIVERVAEDMRQDLAARGGRLRVQGDFATIDGDDVLLRQAFSNLCRNALEACTDPAVAPDILVEGSIDERQGLARIRVVDNGPGIEPAVAARMFRPFFSTKARGTGLGLALVQKIIVTHNGRVAVESGTPGGAIAVTLPLPSAEQPVA
jgi:PAS domain S-box-containing protein